MVKTSGKFLQVDTTILFICGGAFAGLDKIISQRDKGSSIGFGADVKNIKDKKKVNGWRFRTWRLSKIWIDSEFIGIMIATLEDLDEKSLIKILKNQKILWLNNTKNCLNLMELSSHSNTLKEIAQKAIQKKTGARG